MQTGAGPSPRATGFETTRGASGGRCATRSAPRRGRAGVEADDVTNPHSTSKPEPLDQVVIRFAGDSGDGMQLTGDRFTDVSAAFGNDLATLPNFPAEIRAPAGTIAGRVVVPGAHLRPRHRHARATRRTCWSR